MNEVVIVHLLGVDDVTVLLLTQVLRVDAVGSQKLLVSHTEGLADGLSDELCLKTERRTDDGEPDNEVCVCVCVLRDRIRGEKINSINKF